ncbi:ATP-binding protein [Noviherbaspirillum sp.]|jgi:two-component system sensor histidine kinase UhpB|uniref:HAMP domain-containing sensor histidine kinase n=1 Tax=Noviherbaspirillum sp. TaxID=1926288 RepID=UPI0025CE63B7|nr:ATP-binding protein [Noviherbaspirillum sp.]
MTLRLDEMRLHTRISLVLTALAAALVLALGSLWLKQTRDGIHEEVEAATRVAEQWLTVSARELHARQGGLSSEQLLAHLRAVGRIRANALEVVDATGARRYLSPRPTYKAGRAAPGWFAAMVETGFATRRIDAGELALILHPDASRATLDAWDDLCAMAGWAAVLLAALFFTVRQALDRALRPLGQVMAALDRTGRGCFDTRLPVFPEPELGRLAKAFNGMADRLVEAVNDNVRLGSERELNERLQARIEADRRSIARELHDELAQGITAVRALAGAIAQRTAGQPALHAPAQSIVAVTSQMQDGVRTILHRLRPQQGSHGASVDDALGRYLQAWQRHYPDIRLGMQLAGGNEPVSDSVIEAIVRITQEGLTNVVRHAAATRVEISLRRLETGDGGWLELVLADNGRGLGAPTSSAGCGLGLAGMRERAVALAGELRFDTSAGGGTRLCVRLPVTKNHPVEQTT